MPDNRIPVPIIRGPRGPRGGREGWLIASDEALFALHAAAKNAIAAVPGSTVKVSDVISKALDLYSQGRTEYDEGPNLPGMAGFVYEIKIGDCTFLFGESGIFQRFNFTRTLAADPPV